MPASVAALFVYPVKSLRAVPLPTTAVEKRGLQFDRRWMLVDDEGTFLTQRSDPRMSQLQQSLTPEGFVIEAKGHPLITIPYEPQPTRIPVKVWSSDVQAETVSEEADAWFTQVLGRSARLVKMPEDARRRPGSREALPGDLVGFADSDPILVTSTASLADLNNRLERPVEIQRFRSNIVLDGIEPWQEDELQTLQIGEVHLRRTRRCGRCSVTTIDLQTGLPGEEPLRTLATYRRFGSSVAFGSYFVPDRLGEIRIGDAVTLPAA